MGFSFGKNVLELEIEGATYTVDPFADTVLRGVNDFRSAISGADMIEVPEPEKVLELCGQVKGMVNAVLGDGAYDAIFGERKVNLIDHYELAMHIIASVMAFRSKRIAEFTSAGIVTAQSVMTGGRAEAAQ